MAQHLVPAAPGQKWPGYPAVTTFRFWQKGPGYDRNISEPGTLQATIEYIHKNPVRRGLCQAATDWKWSSARRFLLPESAIDPDLPELQPLPYGADDRLS